MVVMSILYTFWKVCCVVYIRATCRRMTPSRPPSVARSVTRRRRRSALASRCPPTAPPRPAATRLRTGPRAPRPALHRRPPSSKPRPSELSEPVLYVGSVLPLRLRARAHFIVIGIPTIGSQSLTADNDTTARDVLLAVVRAAVRLLTRVNVRSRDPL